MGLKADFEEVAKDWKAAPWRIRLWLALSLFVAAGSIASLAETVAKWKSFLLDGINFYRKYISLPIEHLLSQVLALPLPAGVADSLVFIALLVAANLRVVLYRGGSSRTRASALGVLLSPVLLFAMLLAWKGRDLSAQNLLKALVAIAAYSASMYWSIGGAARLLWFASVLGPFVLVGVAAAINVGLFK